MDSISKIGVLFILYLFVVVISYFIMSTPVTLIFDGFDDADFGDAEDEMDSTIGIVRNAFTIAMACMVSIPVTWLVTKIFSREPYYDYYRRM